MAVFTGNPYTEPITYRAHDRCHPTWAGDYAYPLDETGERICWTPLYGDRPCDVCGGTLNVRDCIHDDRQEGATRVDVLALLVLTCVPVTLLAVFLSRLAGMIAGVA